MRDEALKTGQNYMILQMTYTSDGQYMAISNGIYRWSYNQTV
jgi:hypothetical protein